MGFPTRSFRIPVSDQLNVFYQLEKQGTVKFTVLDTSGRVIRSLSQQGYYGVDILPSLKERDSSGFYEAWDSTPSRFLVGFC